jgi:hypothetical protein
LWTSIKNIESVVKDRKLPIKIKPSATKVINNGKGGFVDSYAQ